MCFNVYGVVIVTERMWNGQRERGSGWGGRWAKGIVPKRIQTQIEVRGSDKVWNLRFRFDHSPNTDPSMGFGPPNLQT